MLYIQQAHFQTTVILTRIRVGNFNLSPPAIQIYKSDSRLLFWPTYIARVNVYHQLLMQISFHYAHIPVYMDVLSTKSVEQS